ncbi:hypothetical protein [Pseudomonas veronii]|uniref:hypothetical protein n=1 Tax=Pseudomonas veronii TaxID=76761 RepID=UPI0015A46813|nr:hypothetical protein [Pseudomonas veronii]NWC59721.1 hypothetical protein [Pseudomonas veronii]
MQYLHALKLGDDSRLDKAADAWMRGKLSGRDANYLRRKEEERQYLNGSKNLPPVVIGEPSKKEEALQDVEEEDDDELLALLNAISDIQEANRERRGTSPRQSKTLH